MGKPITATSPADFRRQHFVRLTREHARYRRALRAIGEALEHGRNREHLARLVAEALPGEMDAP